MNKWTWNEETDEWTKEQCENVVEVVGEWNRDEQGRWSGWSVNKVEWSREQNGEWVSKS